MAFGCDNNEDCYYGYWIYNNKNIVDGSFLYNSEIAYNSIDLRRCYNMYFCQDCSDCNDLFLCYDCIGSRDCFGSCGLRRGQYYIFNEKFSRQEYEKRIKVLREEWKTPQGQAALRERFQKLKISIPHRYLHELESENCTGDYVYNSRSCFWSFDIRRCQDSEYLYNTFDLKNCSDVSYAKEGELLYECVSCMGLNFNYCYIIWLGSNLDFCELCFSCSDCIGCIGLKNKRFCILNTQYSEDEYRREAAHIKGELREAGYYCGRLPQIFWEG